MSGLVAILSPERSGSTLLSVALGAHSRVIAPPETHLFRFPGFDELAQGYPEALPSLDWLLDRVGGEDGAKASDLFAGRTAAEVARDLLERAPDGSFLVEKTPAYSRDAEALRRLEEHRPFYVWLVRHPLGVAASRTLRRRARIRGPLEILRWKWRRHRGTWTRWELSEWLDVNRRVRAFLEGIERSRRILVRFEDLVRDPEAQLGRITAAIGLDLEPAMLRPDEQVPDAVRWGTGDEKVRTIRGFDPAVADRWRETHSTRDLPLAVRRFLDELERPPAERRDPRRGARVVCVVPAFHEEGSVAEVVRELRARPIAPEVVVVDDASTDRTGAVARAAGATVLRLASNLGIGGAVQTGFRYALETGADAAVQVDGDGQHPPADLDRLVRPVLDGEADVVIGSRFLAEGGFRSTATRRAGIAVLGTTLRALTGRRFTDPTSGYRAFSRRVLEAFAREYPEDYPEPESLLPLVREVKARIVEVPVTMRARQSGRSSIRGPMSLYYMAKVLTAVIVGRLR